MTNKEVNKSGINYQLQNQIWRGKIQLSKQIQLSIVSYIFTLTSQTTGRRDPKYSFYYCHFQCPPTIGACHPQISAPIIIKVKTIAEKTRAIFISMGLNISGILDYLIICF